MRWCWRVIGDGESDAQSGWTALIFAAEKGHVDCARLLIDTGADKDARNNVRRWVLLCRVALLKCIFHFFVFLTGLINSQVQVYDDLLLMFLLPGRFSRCLDPTLGMFPYLSVLSSLRENIFFMKLAYAENCFGCFDADIIHTQFGSTALEYAREGGHAAIVAMLTAT